MIGYRNYQQQNDNRDNGEGENDTRDKDTRTTTETRTRQGRELTASGNKLMRGIRIKGGIK